jgi:hypothetical protein
MMPDDIVHRIQARTDSARSGYVKAWKNNSIVWTIDSLVEAGADMTLERIMTLVQGSYQMEGIDQQTIDDVSLMLAEYCNKDM